MLRADGFDEAIIGIGNRCGQPDILAYDVNKCVKILMDQGMTEEEAIDYFEFNVVGAWMGEETPIFIREIYDDER
jgi:hypothetical protein|tara:strand:- start:389 stop:613 length:225 start_codon:yes stop_codon:yes gene_type:complete